MSEPVLLPPNATPAELAIEQATSRPSKIPTWPFGSLFNPQKCPDAILPWLAWALSVDSWDPTWSDVVKRATIAASIPVLKLKGTVGALKRALSAVGYNATPVESTTTPFTFSVSLDAVLGGGAAIPYDAAQAIALLVKPVRSKLGDISVSLEPAVATAQYGVALSTGINLYLST